MTDFRDRMTPILSPCKCTDEMISQASVMIAVRKHVLRYGQLISLHVVVSFN